MLSTDIQLTLLERTNTSGKPNFTNFERKSKRMAVNVECGKWPRKAEKYKKKRQRIDEHVS